MGKIYGENLLGKFAGKICGENLWGKFTGKFIGKIYKESYCKTKVPKFWFICLFYSKRLFFSCCCNSKQTYGYYVSLYIKIKSWISHILFYFTILRTDAHFETWKKPCYMTFVLVGLYYSPLLPRKFPLARKSQKLC